MFIFLTIAWSIRRLALTSDLKFIPIHPSNVLKNIISLNVIVKVIIYIQLRFFLSLNDCFSLYPSFSHLHWVICHCHVMSVDGTVEAGGWKNGQSLSISQYSLLGFGLLGLWQIAEKNKINKIRRHTLSCFWVILMLEVKPRNIPCCQCRGT